MNISWFVSVIWISPMYLVTVHFKIIFYFPYGENDFSWHSILYPQFLKQQWPQLVLSNIMKTIPQLHSFYNLVLLMCLHAVKFRMWVCKWRDDVVMEKFDQVYFNASRGSVLLVLWNYVDGNVPVHMSVCVCTSLSYSRIYFSFLSCFHEFQFNMSCF